MSYERVDLSKSPLATTTLEQSRVSLEKVARDLKIKGLRSQLFSSIDHSGSMRDIIYSGVLDGVVTQSTAIGLMLDDDGKIKSYKFNSDYKKLPDITAGNVKGYVAKHIQPDNGTKYSPVMKAILRDMKPGDPALVLFYTDGNPDREDEEITAKLLVESSDLPVFWMFVGMSAYGKGSFPFLNRLDKELQGRQIDNAGFMDADLSVLTPETFQTSLLSEYKDFPAKAQALGFLDTNMKWRRNRYHKVFGIF